MNVLENNIDKLIKYINENNLGFGWKNHPNRTHEGTYKQGECFDYVIINSNGVFCFDAKETIKDRWVIKAKDIKQGANLEKVSTYGHDCFFLIYFKQFKEIKKVPITIFNEILKTRKYIKSTDCINFNEEVFLK